MVALGRLFIEDKRDKKYRLRPKSSRRTHRYWRCGPITNQGAESSCVGHAWRNFLTSSPVRQHALSADGIYKLAQYLDEWEGNDYDGTSVRAGAKVLSLTGHIKEYGWIWELDKAVNFLLNNGPLVIGVEWFSEMSYPDDKFVIHASGQKQGGHAILAYGANTKIEVVALRNSWGKTWGRNGNCLISFEDFKKLLNLRGECCSAKEKTAK